MFKPTIVFSRFHRSVFSIVLALLLCLSNPLAGFAADSSSSVAHVVIQFAAGNTIVREIHFDSATITGLQALQLTGLPIVTQSSDYGEMVCSISGVGSCSDFSAYWNYSYWSASAWQSYMVGASSSTVSDGGVEGWRFGTYDVGALPEYGPFQAASAALDWLRTQQVPATGGFSSPLETLLAIGSNGENAADWRSASESPSFAAYMMANSVSTAQKGADSAGKLATGLHAAGGCWLVNAPKPASFYNSSTGAYGTGSYGAGHQAWAILGEKAFGETIPAQAVTYLKSLVKSNGGWEWDATFGTDSNTTSLVIQALIAAGESPSSTLIQNAFAYLATAQNSDGGFTYDPASPYGTASDTNSTAYAIMAILAAGQDPTAAAWTKGSNNPISFLLSQQHSNGSFQFQSASPADDLIATDQAITALLGKYYPLPGSSLAQCPTLYLPVVLRH